MGCAIRACCCCCCNICCCCCIYLLRIDTVSTWSSPQPALAYLQPLLPLPLLFLQHHLLSHKLFLLLLLLLLHHLLLHERLKESRQCRFDLASVNTHIETRVLRLHLLHRPPGVHLLNRLLRKEIAEDESEISFRRT